MMMMIASNSFARYKEGVPGEGEGEEKAGDQTKGGQTGTPTSDADAPRGFSRSKVLDTRSWRKHGRRYGFLLYRRAEGARD